MATVALVQRSVSRHRAFFLEALRDIPAVSSVALVDTDGGSRDEARRIVTDKPLRVYDTAEAMLAAESPAMAIVSFPAAESPPHVRTILDAGLPTLFEKPACTRLEELAPLVELADRKGVPLMMALCQRLAPWAIDARRVVRAGGIGRLYAASVTTVADQTRIWQERTRDWSFRKAEAGGGFLIWLGIHWLDILLHVTGERVAEVQAMVGNIGRGPIDVEDVATVNLRFESGAQASLTSGYLLDGPPTHLGVTLWGAAGWLRCDPWGLAVDWHGTGPEMQGANDRRFQYDARGGDYTPWTRACLQAALGEAAPPVTGAEALEVLRVIFAAYRSAETGQTVRLR